VELKCRKYMINLLNVWYFWGILLGTCLLGCERGKRNVAERTVGEWIGREVVFSEGTDCVYLGKDTLCPSYDDVPYTVLVYTDSIGCTSCRLNLATWKRYMREIDSIAPGQVGFVFYFQPKNRKELELLLRRERLEQVVFVDRDGSLAQTNRFPEDMAYQCFLLDHNNTVLAIGNPTLNPKLWDLYKAIITGESHKLAVGKSNARAP